MRKDNHLRESFYEQLRFEELINDFYFQLVNLPSSKVNSQIEISVQRLVWRGYH